MQATSSVYLMHVIKDQKTSLTGMTRYVSFDLALYVFDLVCVLTFTQGYPVQCYDSARGSADMTSRPVGQGHVPMYIFAYESLDGGACARVCCSDKRSPAQVRALAGIAGQDAAELRRHQSSPSPRAYVPAAT